MTIRQRIDLSLFTKEERNLLSNILKRQMNNTETVFSTITEATDLLLPSKEINTLYIQLQNIVAENYNTNTFVNQIDTIENNREVAERCLQKLSDQDLEKHE